MWGIVISIFSPAASFSTYPIRLSNMINHVVLLVNIRYTAFHRSALFFILHLDMLFLP